MSDLKVGTQPSIASAQRRKMTRLVIQPEHVAQGFAASGLRLYIKELVTTFSN